MKLLWKMLISISCVIKDDDKFYPQLSLEETIISSIKIGKMLLVSGKMLVESDKKLGQIV